MTKPKPKVHRESTRVLEKAVYDLSQSIDFAAIQEVRDLLPLMDEHLGAACFILTRDRGSWGIGSLGREGFGMSVAIHAQHSLRELSGVIRDLLQCELETNVRHKQAVQATASKEANAAKIRLAEADLSLAKAEEDRTTLTTKG